MIKKIAAIYKTPILVSAVLSIVLAAARVELKPLNLLFIAIGAFFGTFLLDLDYIIYAYFLEPKTDFSKTVVGFLKHGDVANALNYIYYHKDELKDKTLNSALFQVVLGVFMFFVISTETNLVIKTLVVSTFVNSIYRLYENYYMHKTDDWFWILKQKPTTQMIKVYFLLLLGVLVYCITIY